MTQTNTTQNKTHTPSNCPHRDRDEHTFGCSQCMPITQNKEELSEELKDNIICETGSEPDGKFLRIKTTDELITILTPILNKSISQAHQSGIEEERKRNLLDLAEAQFLGFHHGRWNRDDIAGLVFSMGLTKEEWKQLNKKFSMSYLTKEDRKEIEEALKENKQ